ncbi:MAG: methyl-accepting chemotaxis protein, partial [Thermostichales cyanobacterium SZTDM-1c_bins_54]
MVQTTAHQREFQRAIEAYASGDYTLTIDILSTVVESRPQDHNARLWLASAQHQLGQYQQAYANYQRVLQETSDPEMQEWARNSLATLADVIPSGTNTPPAAESGSPFASPEDLFNPESSGAAAKGSDEDLFEDLFSAPSRESSGGAFDDLFDTGLEMLNEMEQTVIDPNIGNIPIQSGAPPTPMVTVPVDDFGANSPVPTDPLQDFDALGSLSDFEDDNVTQIANDLQFSVADTATPPPRVDPPMTQFMPFAADPLSEPIPAPDELAAGEVGPTLLDVDELDSVDQEIAGLSPGEQLDDLFVTQDLSSIPAPVPPVPPKEAPAPSKGKQSSTAPIADTGRSKKSSAGQGGWLANRPAAGKQLMITLVQGVTTLVVGSGAYFLTAGAIPNQTSRAIAGVTGGALAGAVVGWLLGGSVTRYASDVSQELMQNFLAVGQGNYGVRATVRSNDEWGRLSNSFNQMVQAIEATVGELQKQVAEQAEAKEDLHRQVIRLLDDVEGAARGDLTVRAEVTANVLGAVADSFNLTIRSLRDIVSQVKRAAAAVSEAAYQNEEFARGLSADALRQAEEIARSLNSVQVMTESIQQVASNAREAAEVGRRATEAARRGGEAVDLTVSGILEIRETVAETTRQVKRLAESSQEINKIVALISTIASRTNLLALNASIEAARAGEAGRGFSIVADEVRQLADRAAKSSKEIEQLVLQIQSETKTVMTAMENGTQQVIEGTRRAEQAKSSLDEIIEVSRTIDALVRSISEATVQQTETSRSVSQVMQTVQLTAN